MVWQVSTNGVTYTTIPGATSATYSFTATAAQSGEYFRAVFSNGLGTATTTAAKVLVNLPPTVTVNPTSQAVNAGLRVTFTAAATGSPAPSVAWQVSTNNGTTYTAIPGATSTSYTFATTAAQSGYLYRAAFTSVTGTATTTAAKLVVDTVPVVTTNPLSQTITAGKSVSFTVAATGNPTPSVTWQVSTNGGANYTTIPGATSTTYTFVTTTAQSGYLYRAVFGNGIGTATTVAATLKVTASSGLVTLQPAAVAVVLTQRLS